MQALIIKTEREGYGIDQVPRTMTVADLICCLEQYDDDTPIYLDFDNGYTYGSLTERRIELREFTEGGDPIE